MKFAKYLFGIATLVFAASEAVYLMWLSATPISEERLKIVRIEYYAAIALVAASAGSLIYFSVADAHDRKQLPSVD